MKRRILVSGKNEFNSVNAKRGSQSLAVKELGKFYTRTDGHSTRKPSDDTVVISNKTLERSS